MNLKLLIVALVCCVTATAQENTWKQKAELPAVGRLGASVFVIGTKAYIGTGYTNPGQTCMKDIWEWDQATNAWTQKADFGGIARSWGSGFSIGSKGYIGMGSDASVGLSDIWEFDPALNTWTQRSDYPYYAASSASFAIGGKGYILASSTRELWEYDPIADNWTQKTTYPGAGASSLTAFTIGNKGYAGLGVITNNTNAKDFWQYDPVTDTWIQKANLASYARYSAVGFGIGGRGFIGLGRDFFGVGKDFWEYDTLSNSWTQRAYFGGDGRWVCVSFAVGDKGYVGTGYSVNQGTTLAGKQLWEYTPAPPLKVASVAENKELSVYPNPVISTTTIHIDKAVHNANLTICNAIGQQVKQIQNISGQDITIQREDLPAGAYTISISQEGKNVATGKLVVAN